MKISMANVFNAKNGLNEFSKECRPNATLSFKISRIMKKLKFEIDTYDDSYKLILQENMILGEDGKPEVFEENDQNIFKFKEDCLVSGPEELEKLRNSEIDINIEKLSISEFKDSSGKDLDISPNIFTKIDSIMEE
jgi:hypothetical protein